MLIAGSNSNNFIQVLLNSLPASKTWYGCCPWIFWCGYGELWFDHIPENVLLYYDLLSPADRKQFVSYISNKIFISFFSFALWCSQKIINLLWGLAAPACHEMEFQDTSCFTFSTFPFHNSKQAIGKCSILFYFPKKPYYRITDNHW